MKAPNPDTPLPARVVTPERSRSPERSRRGPTCLPHPRPPAQPTAMRSLSPSAQDVVNPPQPPKTHKPRINTGDLYFQNLAYFPPPTAYNRDSPQTPQHPQLQAPSRPLTPLEGILYPQPTCLPHLPALFPQRTGVLCPLTHLLAWTYTLFLPQPGDTLPSNPSSFTHLHPIFTPRGGEGVPTPSLRL